MILLLGASGYIGQAFAKELAKSGAAFSTLSRSQLDYTSFEVLLKHLRETQPKFVINAAGYTGKPNVDACETARAETLQGNTILPATIAHACAASKIPWGHVSSGCIFAGAKIMVDDIPVVEKDLTLPDLMELATKTPEAIHGFTETDEPNFTFRRPPCSFYSGTKALAEEALANISGGYIWRLRIPFDEFDNSRNYLSKLQRYAKVYDNVNSISHRADFARACLELWNIGAPFGIYNVTNPGFVTARQVVAKIQEKLKPQRKFEFWMNDDEFYRIAARTPRSNCVMDPSKLISAGVKIRPVEEALDDALTNWKKED